MRKYTLGLLAFLTFMPSLVCMMAVCPMKSAQAGEVTSCHEVSQSDQNNVKNIMLVQDCLGVDFFQQDVTSDFSPDNTLTDIDFITADISTAENINQFAVLTIRGPPSTADTRSARLPLYLTTQRFRI